MHIVGKEKGKKRFKGLKIAAGIVLGLWVTVLLVLQLLMTDAFLTRTANRLAAGFTDSFRYLYPDRTDAYSWWSYRMRARERNVGWRIDYFVISDRLREKVKDAYILPEIMGSDHCPGGLDVAW